MPLFLLVRHALTDWVGRAIAGRTPGIPLNARGREQAAALARALAPVPIARIVSSPLERAQETAAAIAAGRGLALETAHDLAEVDWGDWTGQPLDGLRGDARWDALHAFRSGHRLPGGESFLDVQRRVVDLLLTERERDPAPAGAVVLCSHADVIRAAVIHFLGLPLDQALRLRIPPASVTALQLDDRGVEVLAVGWTPAPPGLETE